MATKKVAKTTRTNADQPTPPKLVKAMKTPAKKPGGTSREVRKSVTTVVKRPDGASPGRWVGHRPDVSFVRRSKASKGTGRKG